MIGLRRRPLQTGIIDDITGPAVDRMLDEAHPETAPPEINFTLDETDPQPQQPASLPHLIDDHGSSLESIGRDFVGIAAPFARMVQRSAAATSPTGMHFNHDPIRSLPPGANAPIQPDMQTDDPWANEEPLSPDMLRTAQSRANGIESGKLPGFAADDDGEAVASSAPLTMNKGGQNPFAVSPEDKQRMQQAERADRRGRIARGILSALGGVTQIGASLAGGSPVAALGQGLYGVGQGVPTNRAAQEQGRQDRNAQQAMRYAAYDQQQAMAASERERHAQEMALRQRSAESNMAVDQARIQQLAVSTQQAQNEIDAAGADSAAARNILAHFAAGLNDNSPAADQLRAAIADPSFAGMSAQTAREVMARYAQLANRRGAGLIDNGGGGGSMDTIINADGSITQVRRGGGARRPQTSNTTQVTPPGTPAPAPAPVGSGARRPTPAHAPVVTPAPTPAAPPDAPMETDEIGSMNWMRRVLERVGITDRDSVGGYVLRYNGGDTSRRNVVDEVARLQHDYEAARDDGGRPADVPVDEWRRMTSEMRPIITARRSVSDLLGRLRSYQQHEPASLRYAIGTSATDPMTGQDITDAQMQRGVAIRAEILGLINPLLSERSGAAVTDNELRRLGNEFGLGHFTTDPNVFLNALRRQVRAHESRLLEIGGAYSGRAVRTYLDRQLRRGGR